MLSSRTSYAVGEEREEMAGVECIRIRLIRVAARGINLSVVAEPISSLSIGRLLKPDVWLVVLYSFLIKAEVEAKTLISKSNHGVLKVWFSSKYLYK